MKIRHPLDDVGDMNLTQIPPAGLDLGLLSWPPPEDGRPRSQGNACASPGMGGMDSLDLSALAGNLAKDHKAMAIMELHYQSMHAVSTVFDGTKYSRTEIYAQTFDMKLTVAGDPEAAKALMEKIRQEWSPDKVADRIADFATAGFGRAGLPQERSAFRDLIQQAIESGYSQAKGLLGPLGDETASSLEETMKKIRERLDAWVKGPEPSAL